MPDVPFTVFSDSFRSDLKAMERFTDAQTAVGLRAVARELVRAEKRLAPVYGGPKGITRRSLKAEGKKPNRNGRPVIGLLKFSVRASRMRRTPEGYRTVVGPGGGRVNLYKGKIERKYGFAEKAYGEVVPAAREIMAVAWGRALRRGA